MNPPLHSLLLCPLLAVLPVDAAEPAPRPNILIILADDLGYSDLGCYGGEIRTPALDALAADGLRFTRCYNSSRCCPSRASLLTGLFPHQAGIGRFVGRGKVPGYLGRLNEECVTLAEVLDPAGYAAYACGKWHVNDPVPTERGFREFYGFVHGYGIDSWDPDMMIRLPDRGKARRYPPGGFFATEAITDHALDFLDAARETDRPWLLYTAYQVAHFPVQAPVELSATYDEIYEKGWDVLREERLARMKKLGLIDEEIALPPRERIDNLAVAERLGSLTEDKRNPAWESLPADRRADLARRMAVYAAMVEGMDRNIGRLVDSLRENDELENTLILFLSDNGACAEWEPFGFDLAAADYTNHKPGHGINGGTPNKPNRVHTGDELAAMGGPGSLFSYGSAWANLSNTPLALYKHYAHEGGIRTPLIVHWPKEIGEGGALRDQVVHLVDVMATCVDVARADYPESFEDRKILPMEGRSLRPTLADQPSPPRTLLVEHERNAALILGDWKLVGETVIRKNDVAPLDAWRLFNLAEDPVEQRDLSAKHPERVKAMREALLEEAKRTRVLPAP